MTFVFMVGLFRQSTFEDDEQLRARSFLASWCFLGFAASGQAGCQAGRSGGYPWQTSVASAWDGGMQDGRYETLLLDLLTLTWLSARKDR